jgi:hypothetical protein
MKFFEFKGPSDVIHDHMILSGCTVNNNAMEIKCLPDIADDDDLKSICIDLFASTDTLQLSNSSKVTSLHVSPPKERQRNGRKTTFSLYIRIWCIVAQKNTNFEQYAIQIFPKHLVSEKDFL